MKDHPTPPSRWRALLQRRLSTRREEVLDDLDWLFTLYVEQHGLHRARWIYRYEVLIICFWGIGERAKRSYHLTGVAMYVSYLKMALRVLSKHKGYASINVAGLSLGMACCVLILLYVGHELSYDDFHVQADQIYRVQMDRYEDEEKLFSSAVTFPAVAPALQAEMPEVEAYARLLPSGGVFAAGAVQYREEQVFYADSTVLTLFTYPLQYGDRETALTDPNSIVLSAAAAQKYFGDRDPVGETLQHNGRVSYTVTGVLEVLPGHSHLDVDVLLSFATLEANRPNLHENWGWYDFYTYIQLHPSADPAVLEARLTDFMAQHKADMFGASGRWETLLLQPLPDIHLYSNLSWEAGVNGNGSTVYFLLVIAFFILLIAWVNFINLATARSMQRAREVGVRKALGAPQGQLIRQFLLEAGLVNLIGALLAVGLVALVLPAFVQLTGMPVHTQLSDHPMLLGTMAGVFLAGALLAGIYPAWVLSAFKPVRVLKGEARAHGRSVYLRKGMVVFQFAASIILIAGTLIVGRQVDHMRAQDLGIDLEQTLVLRGPSVLPDPEAFAEQASIFRDEVHRLPGVSGVTASSTVPGLENFWIGGMRSSQMEAHEARDVYIVGVDEAFFPSFNIELVAGRNFSPEFGSDQEAFILNESAVHLLGFDDAEEALNGFMDVGEHMWPIIGVVKDYHQSSLQQGLDPVGFRYFPDMRQYYAVKVQTPDVSALIASLEEIWQGVFPGNPYEYFFLDDFFDQQYRADQRFGQIFGLFAGLAILVACLGLLGLVSFSVAQRTKEIGIRKVLGASVPGILGLISREYAVLIIGANILAGPVAYVVMNRWLDRFAYRIEPGIDVFLLAGMAVLGIAALTVCFNALRAARAKPVDALRYE